MTDNNNNAEKLGLKKEKEKGTSMIVTSLVQSNCKKENFITNEITGCILQGHSYNTAPQNL
jgi:hypothetical protein